MTAAGARAAISMRTGEEKIRVTGTPSYFVSAKGREVLPQSPDL
jgi:hypothetical protein